MPVGVADPLERLADVGAQMAELKASQKAVAGEVLTSLSGFAPSMLLALGMRAAARSPQMTFETVTTNVPGPQRPLYAAGRRMVVSYPYVPVAGAVRIVVAIFSYDGHLAFGVTGDHDAVAGHRRPLRGDRGGDRRAAGLAVPITTQVPAPPLNGPAMSAVIQPP